MVVRGKGSVWEVFLDHNCVVGRIWAPRGVRPCSVKPKANAERTEMAEMTINFTVGRR